MGPWTEFIAAMAAFLASHVIPARPGLRAALVGRLSHAGYGAIYGLVSLALLVWVIGAAGRAPVLPLWDQAVWMRWLVNLVMPVACLLAAFAIGAINPFSFGGRSANFDPERPGVAGVTRHPLLWALILWAGAHLIVNGDLAHVALFGTFAGFALLGMIGIDARNRRRLGAAEWARQTARTGFLPFAALLTGRWRPSGLPSPLRLAAGLVAWVGLWHLHAPVIGFWPGP